MTMFTSVPVIAFSASGCLNKTLKVFALGLAIPLRKLGGAECLFSLGMERFHMSWRASSLVRSETCREAKILLL